MPTRAQPAAAGLIHAIARQAAIVLALRAATLGYRTKDTRAGQTGAAICAVQPRQTHSGSISARFRAAAAPVRT